MSTRFLVLALALALAGVAWAGPRVRLELTDGSRVEGALEAYEGGVYRVVLGGQVVAIPEGDVAQIAFVQAGPAPIPSPAPSAAPIPSPAPSAAPIPSPAPSAAPSPSPAPAPSPLATPAATPNPPPPVASPAAPLTPLQRAFSYVPRVGDTTLVKRWERVVRQRGDTFEEQVLELRYVDRVEAMSEGQVLVRTRRYEAQAGHDDLPDLVGVVLRITRRGPQLFVFERLDGEPVTGPWKAALIEEFEHERGLASHEFLPEEPVAPGESWSLALTQTHMYRQFVALGLEVHDTESGARGVLLEPRGDQLGVALTFSVKPVALNGIPFDASAHMTASTSLWVPADGSGPISRLEESGQFRCRIQGDDLRMEVTKVVEVEFQPGD